jgi:hypothetical protein
MSKLIKSVMTLVLTTLLLGFGSANAQTFWEGKGEGVCSPPPVPSPIADFPIYGWQHWEGVLDSDVFYGKWKDEDGNYGEFKAEVMWDGPWVAKAKGEWTWFDNNGISPFPPTEYVMGDFFMKFYINPGIFGGGDCEGEWFQQYTGEHGVMKGFMQ